MLHTNRTYAVQTVPTLAELADRITRADWCLCQGFEAADRPGLLVLNDSRSPDALQEYAVVRRTGMGEVLQLDSLTVSWMKTEDVLPTLEDRYGWPDRRALFGPLAVTLENAEGHTCRHCR